MNFFVTLFLLSQFFLQVWGYSVELLPGVKDCFIIMASVGSPVTGSFEVIHPDSKYIKVRVTNPKGFLHYEKQSKEGLGEEAEAQQVAKDGGEESSEGFFSFDAEVDGEHTMCIANGDEMTNDGVTRLIAFNFRANADSEKDYQFVGLQSELADLREGLDLLKDHQSYMNQREDVHKDSVERIYSKVLLWTVLEAIILVGLAIWQIVYIRGFFEVKRKF